MILISERGLMLLQHFTDNGRGYYMTIAEAESVDQRPFRSALVRKYIEYVGGRGFKLTQKGRDAWNTLHETSIERSPGMLGKPLTRYFDPDAYGLHVVKKMRGAA